MNDLFDLSPCIERNGVAIVKRLCCTSLTLHSSIRKYCRSWSITIRGQKDWEQAIQGKSLGRHELSLAVRYSIPAWYPIRLHNHLLRSRRRRCAASASMHIYPLSCTAAPRVIAQLRCPHCSPVLRSPVTCCTVQMLERYGWQCLIFVWKASAVIETCSRVAGSFGA